MKTGIIVGPNFSCQERAERSGSRPEDNFAGVGTIDMEGVADVLQHAVVRTADEAAGKDTAELATFASSISVRRMDVDD